MMHRYHCANKRKGGRTGLQKKKKKCRITAERGGWPCWEQQQQAFNVLHYKICDKTLLWGGLLTPRAHRAWCPLSGPFPPSVRAPAVEEGLESSDPKLRETALTSCLCCHLVPPSQMYFSPPALVILSLDPIDFFKCAYLFIYLSVHFIFPFSSGNKNTTCKKKKDSSVPPNGC